MNLKHVLLMASLLPFSIQAADLVPVNLPLSRSNYERYYEVADETDLCQTLDWSVLKKKDFAPMTLGDGPSMEGGETGIRMEMTWSGARFALSAVELSGPSFDVAQPCFGMWVRFAPISQPLWLRIKDAKGEVFQYLLRSSKAEDGWNFYVTKNEPIDRWGGNDDGVVDLPFTLHSLVAVQPLDYYVGDTVVEISDFKQMKQIVQPEKKNPIVFALPEAKLGNVYTPGEPVELYLVNDKGAGWSVDWTVEDYWDNSLQSGVTALPEQGEAKLSLNPPAVGFYTLKLRVSNTKGLVDTYDFRFAVMPEREAQVVDESAPFFGMCTHYDHWSHDSLPLMGRYGVQVQRTDFLWRMNEKTKGDFAFVEVVEDAIDKGLEDGVQMQGIINYGNPIYENPSYRNGTFPTDDRVRKAYADYAESLVEHFTNDDGSLKVKYFEIWNEWTYGCGMRVDGECLPGNTPENYIALIKEAYPAIKEANPEAFVIGLGGDNPWKHKQEIFEMMELGLLDYSDAISMHPYRQPAAPEDVRPDRMSMYDEIKAISDKMDEYDSGETKIWLTEFGWPTWSGRGGISEKDQARFIARSIIIMRALPRVENVVFYDLKDDADNYWDNQEHNFGMLMHENYNYAPKPAAVAYAVLSDLLTGATFVEREESAPDVYRFWFTDKDGRDLIIAWTTKDTAQETFDVPGKLTVMNMMGQVTQDVIGDSSVTLTLTGDPIYILSE